MTDNMTAYRHEKIAELLIMIWACNNADSDNPDHRPAWTSPKMTTSVVCPLFQAVRGLLDADYDDWLISGGTDEQYEKLFGKRMMRSEFKDRVIEVIIDNPATSTGANVTSIINFVLDECDPDPVKYDGKTEIVKQLAEQQGWDIYHGSPFATSQAQEDLDYERDMEGYDFVNNI